MGKLVPSVPQSDDKTNETQYSKTAGIFYDVYYIHTKDCN